MRKWFKCPCDLLEDERMRVLKECLGYKGIGVAMAIWIFLESIQNREADFASVCMKLKSKVSKKFIERIILEFDLFHMDDYGIVRIRKREGKREGEREGERRGQRGGEPIRDENIELDYTSVGSAEEDEDFLLEELCLEEVTDRRFDKYRKEPWWPQIAYMLSDHSMGWREAVQMSCGYGNLMRRMWHEAVLYFIMHAIAQSNTHRLLTVNDCRAYFTNMSRMAVKSGDCMMQHLRAAESLSARQMPQENNIYYE